MKPHPDERTPPVLPPDDFARIVELTPLVSFDLLVRDAQGRLLLGLRRNRPAQGWWFVPGGRLGKNERFADAFARITECELGRPLAFDTARFRGAWEHIYPDNFLGDPAYGTHYVVLAWEVPAPAGLALPPAQHEDYLWLGETEILARADVHPNTKAYCAS